MESAHCTKGMTSFELKTLILYSQTTSLEGGGEKSQVTCVQFSSGRERLAVGTHDGTVRYEELFELTTNVYSCRIFDRTTRAKRTYRQANGVKDDDDEEDDKDDAATLVLAGHKSAVACLTFSDDNLMLASGGRVCSYRTSFFL